MILLDLVDSWTEPYKNRLIPINMYLIVSQQKANMGSTSAEYLEHFRYVDLTDEVTNVFGFWFCGLFWVWFLFYLLFVLCVCVCFCFFGGGCFFLFVFVFCF